MHAPLAIEQAHPHLGPRVAAGIAVLHLPRDAAVLSPHDPAHFERVLRERLRSPWHPEPPPAVLEDVRQMAKGGSFGSIMGRNAFQRSRADGAALLKSAIEIFKG